jgi:hypothetical protein
VVTTPKIPGWGLADPMPIREVRHGPQGQPQGLICPPGHEACIWADLTAIAQHNARTIYQ